MIHHLSVPVRDPRHTAQVFLELFGGGVVILAHDAGDSTLPSMSARSQVSRSEGVDHRPPAAPIQPFPSGTAGSASPSPSGV